MYSSHCSTPGLTDKGCLQMICCLQVTEDVLQQLYDATCFVWALRTAARQQKQQDIRCVCMLLELDRQWTRR
jgi:hypothetical protein